MKSFTRFLLAGILLVLAISIHAQITPVASWDYTVTSGPSNPPSLTGSTIVGGPIDDNGYSINWPFSFGVYDNVYTTSNVISVNSNGVMRFDWVIPGGAVAGGNPAIPSTNYGQFISYGGQGDGQIISNAVKVTNGTAPNRVFVIAFTYQDHYYASQSYSADVSIAFHEADFKIVLDYNNVTIGGSATTPAPNIGINGGDTSSPFFGNNLGSFPDQDTSFTFTPGSSLAAPTTFTATAASSHEIDLVTACATDVIILVNTVDNFANLVSGTNYNVNQILTGGAKVLYKGSPGSFTHTGLSQNTTYYYKVLAKNSSDVYSSGSLTANATTYSVTDPGMVFATGMGQTQIDVDWELNAAVDSILLVFNTIDNFFTPVDGQDYTSMPPLNGTILSKSKLDYYVHSGLLTNTTYYYKIWSFDGAFNYSPGVKVSGMTATVADPTYFEASTGGTTVIDLDWTKNGSTDNVMIAYNSVNQFGTPSSTGSYVAGTPISGGGTVLTKDATSNTAGNFAHSSLSSGQKVYYKIWSYDNAQNFSGGIVDSATTATVADPTSFSASASSSSQIDLTVSGFGSNNVIITYNTVNNFAPPQSGSSYSIGQDIQFGQGTVLYKGNGNSIPHPSLPQGTKYYYMVWAYDGSNIYSSPGLLDSTTTLAVANPTAFQMTSSTSTVINLEWDLNSSSDKIMLAYNTTGTFSNPTDGSTYTTTIGASSIIEQSTADVKAHSGLNPGQTIYYKIWSVDAANNYSTGVTLTASTGAVAAPDDFEAIAATGTNIDLTWTRNSAQDSILIAWKLDKNFGSPIDGIEYQANDQFLNPYGRVLGSYYNSPTQHQNLSAATKYYYMAWSFDANYNYSTGILDSATTAGVLDVDSINAWGVTSSRIDFEWWKHLTNDSIMIAWNTTNSFGTPPPSYQFVGNMISLNGDRVLYNGSGSTLSVDDPTKFSPGTTYYFKIYTYTYDPGTGICSYSPGIVVSATTKQPGISIFPHFEDFEDSQVNQSSSIFGCQSSFVLGSNVEWINIFNEAAQHTNWMGRKGGTPTSNTGPAFDHTQGDATGTYVYVESSSCSGREAWLVSPRYNFSSLLQPRITFWYHMYGGSWMGTMSVQVSTDGGTTWSSNLWSQSGSPTSQTSSTSPWLQADVSLQSYAGMNNVKIRIKALTSWSSDMAVDDIKVFEPMNMSYVASSCHQDTNNVAIVGGTDQQVMRVKVTTQGAYTPLNVSSMSFNTNGSTATADITKARLYYTGSKGTNPDFSTALQLGSDLNTPSGAFTISDASNPQTLMEGDNYFWLVYDVSSSATIGNYLDAECASITVSGSAKTPTNYDPQGAIRILGVVTVGTGTQTSPWYDGPMYPSYASGAHETVYTSTEMGGAKEINYIAYYKESGANTGNELNKIRIFMKNSSTSILTNGMYDLSTYTEVFTEQAFPNTKESGWLRAKLDNPFLYDGTSHLHVLVIQTEDPNNQFTPHSQWRYTAATNKVRDNYSSWSSITNLTVNSLRPNTQLQYLPPTPMTYASSEVIQNNTTNVGKGEQEAEIIGVKINTNNTGNPLVVSSLTFTTTGVTNASDLDSARVFYSSGSASFSTATPFGTAYANPNGTFTITGSQALTAGSNYFWLSYDIDANATVDNYVDATCTSIIVGGTTYAPSPTSVTGNRQIKNYITIGDITTATGDNTQPIHYQYNHVWEGIYLSSELGAAFDINSLAFYKTDGVHTNAIPNIEIWMSHTSNSTTTSGTYSTNGYTKVYDGDFTNNEASGWMEVSLSTAFAYDGSSNLSVLVVQTGSGTFGTDYINWANNSMSTARSRKGNHWSTPPANLSLSANNDLPAMRLEISDPQPMSYVSSTTTQNNTGHVVAGLADQEIIGVRVVTANSGTPLDLTSLTFNTNGSTNPANMTEATVYYTGNSATYQAIGQFGSPVTNPNGTFTISGSQTLMPGTNYFWLAYDIPSSATSGHFVDGECTQLNIGSTTYTPALTNPIGSREIKNALSGDYVIGTGGDFLSFTEAITELNTYGVAGWVRFLVKNGTYTENITLSAYANASAANNVTFMSQNQDSTLVTLQYNGTSSSYNTVEFASGASHYIFKQITIKSLNANYGIPVYMSGTLTDIQVRNCVLETTSTGFSAYGVYYNSGAASGVKIVNNKVNGGYYGMRMRGSNTSSKLAGLVVDSNTVIASRYGMQFYYTDGLKVRKNKIMVSSSSSTNYGIYDYYGGGAQSEFTQNDIQMSGSAFSCYGMFMYNTIGLSSDPALIANNFVSQTGTVSGSLVGIFLTSSSYVNVYHNSINIAGTSTSSSSFSDYGAFNNEVSTNIKLLNNHLVNSGGGITVTFDNTTGVVDNDYNNLYTTGSVLAYLNGNVSNLTAWRNATSDAQNSISSNPNFTSTTDLHMNNTAIINEGTPVPEVTKDIDGNTRDPLTPDIGADEKLVNVDMGVVAYITPSSIICSGLTPVEIRIKNFGLNTMYGTSIGWSVDGVTQTATGWVGSLQTDSTAVVTLGNYTFASGNSVIKAWTYNPNGQTDQLTANDTAAIAVTVNGSATVDAGADDFVCYGQTFVTNATASNFSSIVWSSTGTGTFTNPGSLIAEYTPSIADTLAGFVYLHVNVTGSGGCGNGHDSLKLNVYSMPAISFSGLSSVKCPNDANDVLTGTPSGGVFTGSGIVNGNEFSPSTAGSGTHTIWYKYTTLMGCVDSTSQTVTVSPTLYPEITNLALGYCLSTPADTIYGANPAGGTFSGAVSGTSFTIFNPSAQGTGTHDVIYTVVDPTTSCSFDTTYSVQVYVTPSASISGFKTSYCTNDVTDTLIGIPAGGTFSGVGMTGDVFDPAVAGVGAHTIQYIYTDPAGCGDTAYQTLNVHAVDMADFTIASDFCNTDASVALTGTPGGGVFTVNGVTTNLFDPATAILGSNTIEYTYTNSNGCSHITQKSVTVNETPTADAGTDQTITSGTTATLSGNGSGGSGTYTYAWSPAAQLVNANIQNPQTVALTAPQTYTLTVSDASTACSSTDDVTVYISVNTLTAFASVSDDTICLGDTVNLNGVALGGSGVYTYTWTSTPAGFTSSISNPEVYPSVSTTYTLSVNDGTNTATDDIAVVVNPLPLVSFTGLNANYCSNDGLVTLSPSPSVGGAFIGNGIAGNTFNPAVANLGNNDIIFLYTDPNTGCSNATLQSTNVYEAPLADAGSDQTINPNTSTTLSGSATGGGNYKFAWTPVADLVNADVQNPTTINLNASTTFTLTVTDSITGCSDNDDITVYMGGPNLNVVATSDLDTICNGSDVQLDALASGGSSIYTYQWTSKPVGFTSTLKNPLVNPSVPTTYTVQVNDGSSTVIDSVKVFVHNNPSVFLTGLDTSYCTGSLPVPLFGTPIGGTFSGAGVFLNVFIPDSAGPGTHYIKYTYVDVATGCTSEDVDTTHVFQTPVADAGPSHTIQLGHDTILYGGATGGSGNYDWVWSPNNMLATNFTQNVTTIALSATQLYNLEVTDQVSGCTSTDQVVVNVDVVNLTSNATAFPDTICDGDTTTLYAFAAGGSGTYTYSWTSNPIGFTSTAAQIDVYPSVTTTYTVLVNDGLNMHTSQVTVVVNPVPVVSFSGLASSYCSSAPVALLTGSPTGGVFAGQGINGNTFDPLAAGAGFHQIIYYYTDPLTGCSNLDLQATNVIDAPITDAGTDMTIDMGNDTILYGSSTGGANLKYEWTPAALVVNPNNPSTPTTVLSNTTMYTLTVTDTISGCSSSDDVTVNVINPNLLTIVVSTDQYTICEGDSAQLNVVPSGGTGTVTYSWTSTPAGFINSSQNPYVKPTITTQYTVTAQSGTQTATGSVTITVNPKPAVLLSGLNSSYCMSDMPSVLNGFPAGGTFSGNGLLANQFTAASAGAGTHTIKYTYTNAQGCTNSDSLTTVVYDEPTANAGTDVTIPYGNDTILYGLGTGGSGNYVYEWQPASLLLNNMAQNATTVAMTNTTLFTLSVQDQISGCDATDYVKVTIGPSPNLHMNPVAIPDTICVGSSSDLDALAGGGTGTYSYLWVSYPAGFTSTAANPVVSPTVTTTYYVQLNDGNTSKVDSVTVVVDQPNSITIGGYAASYCDNAAPATFTATPAGGIFVGNGMNANVFDPAQAGIGTHQIVYIHTSTYGCITSDTIYVDVVGSPVADAGSDIMINCGGSGAIGSATVPGMSYSWTPPMGLNNATISNPTASPTHTTIYTLTVQDNSTMCQSTDDVLVEILNGPQAVVANDTIICKGSSVNIWASGGSTYQWSNGVTTSAFTASPAATTTYYVTVTDGMCGDVDSVKITVSDLQLNLGPDMVLVDTNTVVLDAGFGFASYQWSTGALTQSITIEPYVNAALGINTYSVTVMDAYGCVKDDQVQIGYVMGMEDIHNEMVVEVYPNPSKGLFELHIDGASRQKVQLTLTNTQGQLLKSEEIDIRSGQYVKNYDLRTYAKGVYLLQIKHEGYTKTEKIVIQ